MGRRCFHLHPLNLLNGTRFLILTDLASEKLTHCRCMLPKGSWNRQHFPWPGGQSNPGVVYRVLGSILLGFVFSKNLFWGVERPGLDETVIFHTSNL